MKRFGRGLKQIFTHWLPNLLLVGGIVLLIQIGLPWAAFLLVAISKWQIWRGGRKLWLRSLRDNGCDLVVAGASLVLMIITVDDLSLMLGVAGLYYLWLILIKPRSGPVWMAVQAGLCQLIGLTVVFLLGRSMPELAVLALAWLVGAVAADHLLAAHQEPARAALTVIWGLLVAQFSWLFWRWLIIYSLVGERILFPQAALVITVFGYTFANIYLDHARKRLGKVRLAEYVLLCAGLFVAIIIGTRWDIRL